MKNVWVVLWYLIRLNVVYVLFALGKQRYSLFVEDPSNDNLVSVSVIFATAFLMYGKLLAEGVASLLPKEEGK